MKRVIDGKLYDTKTATEIAKGGNDLPYSDFHHVEESLYRSPRGRFFLAGGGGPLSKYRVSCGQNSWGGSKDIIPLSMDDAREWCECNGVDVDVIMEHFEVEVG